jgi:putative transposase
VGWHTSPVADTALVLTALEYALALRKPPSDRSLIHHADHGSQGGFNWSSQHLDLEVRDGTAAGLGDAGDGARGDALAGCAFDSS